jgi:hypothetical protein
MPFLNAFISWAIANWKAVLALAVIAALLVGTGLWWACAPSRLEKRIEERNSVIIERQQAANAANQIAVSANANAANAAIASNTARENVNKIQRDRQTNVSIRAANRNRCLAFPDRPECIP